MRHAAESVLIVEPNPDGHRLYYVALLCAWGRSAGRRVSIVTTPEAASSDEWALHLRDADAEVDVLERPIERFSLEDVAHLADESGIELVIIPDGDRFLGPLAVGRWKSPARLSLLAMRPDAQTSGAPLVRLARGTAKKALILAADARARARVFALRSPLSARRPPLRWLGDPVTLRSDEETVASLRLRLIESGPSYWVGVFGLITARKNLGLIASALARDPATGLLVAGRIDPDAEEESREALTRFREAGGVFVHMPPPMDDALFDSAIGAVDCVVVAHSNEGSSGVASKAAAAGRRLVLAGARSLRRDARSLQAQAVWVPLDAERIATAIAAGKEAGPPSSAAAVGHESFARGLMWA